MLKIVSRIERRVPGRADRGERGAVLDEAPLAAVPPDEVRNVVDVGVRAGGDRAQADRGQRRERGDAARVAAVLGEERERGGRAGLDGFFEDVRREPVDHDQDQLLSSVTSRARACAGPRSGAAARRRARWASAGSGYRLEVAEERNQGEPAKATAAARKMTALPLLVPPRFERPRSQPGRDERARARRRPRRRSPRASRRSASRPRNPPPRRRARPRATSARRGAKSPQRSSPTAIPRPSERPMRYHSHIPPGV